MEQSEINIRQNRTEKNFFKKSVVIINVNTLNSPFKIRRLSDCAETQSQVYI